MKFCYTLVLAAILSACAPSREAVTVLKGDAGKDGVSCVSEQASGGVTLTCSNGTIFVSDGTDGHDGAPGVSTGSMVELELSGCTQVPNSDLWAKTVGAGSVKLYANSTCSGAAASSLSSTDEVEVLDNGAILLFQTQTSRLFMLTVGGA